MCGFCNVWVCVCVGFVMCVCMCGFCIVWVCMCGVCNYGCVCGFCIVWVCVSVGFVIMGVCMCGFCVVWVCVCVGFVLYRCVYALFLCCVYVWVL